MLWSNSREVHSLDEYKRKAIEADGEVHTLPTFLKLAHAIHS